MSSISDKYQSRISYLSLLLVAFLLFFFSNASQAIGVGTYVLDDFGSDILDYLDPGYITADISNISTHETNKYHFNITTHTNEVGYGEWSMEILTFGFALESDEDYQRIDIMTPDWLVDKDGSTFGEFGSSDVTVMGDPRVNPEPWATNVQFDLTTINALELATLDSDEEYLFAAKARIGLDTWWLWFTPSRETSVGGAMVTPIPAAAFLFGSALFGFVAFSTRRTIS